MGASPNRRLFLPAPPQPNPCHTSASSPRTPPLHLDGPTPHSALTGGGRTWRHDMELDCPNLEDYLPPDSLPQESPRSLHLRDLLDISPVLTEAAGAIVDGLTLAVGWMVFFAAFFPMHFLLKGKNKLRRKIERKLVEMMCSVFVASWTGVIRNHGPHSSSRPYQVFVANHTSMIDFIILEQMTAFAVIMQKHPGWVGFIQKTILESVGFIWFDHNDNNDREVVRRKMRDHVQCPDNNPLLIFPERTFELGCAVCPIAINYNKIFVDAFWNSKKQSFTMHLVRLMTSRAVECDVWFLEPRYLKEGETAIEFTERVRDMIAARAGLRKVPWDGYLKHNRPSPKHTEEKQRIFAESVLRRLEEN